MCLVRPGLTLLRAAAALRRAYLPKRHEPLRAVNAAPILPGPFGVAATLSCRLWVGPAAVAGIRADLGRLLPAGDRPIPLPSAASPLPTVTARRASARSPSRVRRRNMFWHDADIPLPDYSSQRRTPINEKWPRAPGGATEGLAMRRGFPPPRMFPTGICEICSCPVD